ncbi:hypothetical protein BHM03_00059140 [Ensete ventricosum]|nr:hypothetical protein BHM03_00059140 [Ensete ventricosum]
MSVQLGMLGRTERVCSLYRLIQDGPRTGKPSDRYIPPVPGGSGRGKAPYQAVCTGPSTDWYTDHWLLGGKSTVGSRFQPVLAEGGRKKKREKPGSPTRCSSPIPPHNPSPASDSFSPCEEKEQGDIAFVFFNL